MGAWEAQRASLSRTEVIIVQEMLNSIQADDVYEPPLLAEVGQYAELTQGWGVAYAEGFLVYYDAS
jgi:hypothetical protein